MLKNAEGPIDDLRSFQIEITLPISTNNLWRPLPNGRMARTESYRDWIKAAGREILVQRPKMAFRSLREERWYETRIEINHAERMDLGNVEKASHDLLVSLCMTPDDRRLWATKLTRSHEVLPRRARITAWEVPEGEA